MDELLLIKIKDKVMQGLNCDNIIEFVCKDRYGIQHSRPIEPCGDFINKLIDNEKYSELALLKNKFPEIFI